MKRVVYDESDMSSDPDDKKKDASSTKEESDSEEELDDEEMAEDEDDDDTIPQEPPEPPSEDTSETPNPKDADEEKEAADDDEEEEAQDEDDDDEEEDFRQLLENAQDDESLQRLIQNSLGQLARDGGSPSRDLVLAYAASVSANPDKYQNPSTLKVLLRLLRSVFGRERSSSIEKKASKPKRESVRPGGITLAVLVANLLAVILKSVPPESWPSDCLKVFVDDSLNSRAWVDHDMCAVFVDMIKHQIQHNSSAEVSQRVVEHLSSNVNDLKRGGMSNQYAFKNVMLTLMDLTPLPQGRLIASSNLDLWFQNTNHKTIARELLLKIVRSCTTLDAHDLETVENLLNMKFKSVSFPQLKTEVFTLLVRQRPEYINIAIKVILLKERLAATLKDVDNLKMIPLIFRETAQVVSDRDDKDDSAVFKRVVAQHPGAGTSHALAMVLQEMATVSSNLPTLKNTLRKVIRSLGPDQLDVRALCQGLMSVPTSMQTLEFFVMMGELVALVLFVQGTAVRSLQVNVQEPGPNPRLNLLPKALDKGVRRLGTAPTSNANAGGIALSSGGAAGSQKRPPAKDAKEKPTITAAVKAKEELAQLIADVQRMAVNWCHEVQQLGDQLGMRLFGTVMRKVLFLDMLADMQTSEHDRGGFNFCRDMLPLHETTIVRIVEMCNYANPEETLEILNILDAVVVRAAEGQVARESFFQTQDQIDQYVADGGLMGLHVHQLEFVRHLLESGTVRGHQYDGMAVCYTELYWLGHCILLVLASFNPTPLGSSVWDGVPTMRALMQMVITGRYTFPPVEPEDAKLFDTQPPTMTLAQSNHVLADRERAFFEAHKLPVDHSLMIVQPLHSTARVPPLEVLRKVESLDKALRLGLRLRKSRTKDFLMDMVDVTVSDKRPQSSWSESPERIWWIVEIVCDELDTLSYLPRRCLCELLLLACVEGSGEKSKLMHAMLLQQVPNLLHRLKECIENDNTDVITFFLDRLASPSLATRQLSSYLLDLLTREGTPASLSKSVPQLSFDWLPGLVKLPSFPALHEQVIASLENVLKFESSVDALKLCLGALYDIFADQPNVHLKLAIAIGNLLVQRASVARLLLTDLVVFGRMVTTFWAAIEYQVEHAPTEHTEDWVTVAVDPDLGRAVSAIALPPSVVSGGIELLSFALPTTADVPDSYEKLVGLFFPSNSNFGLWHPTQVYTCSSDHLFRLSCVVNPQLVSAAIRKMTLDVLWRVALSYGRQPGCLLAVLTALQEASSANPDNCLDALKHETSATDAGQACDEALVHLNMYLRQESFRDVRSSKVSHDLTAWLSSYKQPVQVDSQEGDRPTNRFISQLSNLQRPVASVGDSLKIPHALPPPLPIAPMSRLAVTNQQTIDVCGHIQESSHRTAALEWVRVASLGEKKLLVDLGRALAKSATIKFVQVFLHEIIALGCHDSVGTFLQAFLSQHTTTSLLPFSATVLDSIWKLVPWHLHGVWQRIIRLVVAEQSQTWQKTQAVAPSRLALLHNIAFNVRNNLASTITALMNIEAMSAESAHVEAQVVEFIVLDLYASRPHSFALVMDVCAPGWQVNASTLVQKSSSLVAKLDVWLASKDHADALRLVALRHPLLVASRVLHVALVLEGRSTLFLSKYPLDNWLTAINLVLECVFRHLEVLQHVVPCFLVYLEHFHDESKLPTALRILRTIEVMISKDSCAMLPFFTTQSYRIRWVHALANFDVSNPAVVSLTHFLDVQALKWTEGQAWALTSGTSPSVEDQLEQLKTSFQQYSGSAKKAVLPALMEYVGKGDMTKKTAVLICQCLLLLLQSGHTTASQATKTYMACLTSSKVGIREAATFFLLDFLVYCSPAQHYKMLAHLFMEDSDVAKSSISQYFKSDLFKADHS